MWRSVQRTLVPMVKSNPPDAILSYWTHPDGEVAIRAARIAGIPAVVMVGGSDILVLSRKASRRRRVISVLHHADRVITVSHDLRAKLLEFGIDGEKIHVIERGVDTSAFYPGNRVEARRKLGIPADDSVLLWVGRMVPVKGLEHLIEACSKLRHRSVPFRLYLVGNGPLRTSLEEDVKARGLENSVRFMGTALHDALPDWYRAADLMLLPSLSEGVPNVLRESLACGTPFVASRVGGIPEIADDPANRLVPPGDADALANAIAEAVTPPMPKLTRQQPSGDWSRSAAQVVNVIRDVLHEGRRTRDGQAHEGACGASTFPSLNH
jgi:teichuronic acid biosynthesis glycosyltransferase TuaC